MSSFDAVVIGDDGVAAAALLAKAGAHVLLVRAPRLPPSFGPLHALDPELIARLDLIRHGLAFRQRDLPLVSPGDPLHGMPPLVLPRERHAASRALAASADADAWLQMQRQMFARARRLRRFWNHPFKSGGPVSVLQRRAERAAFVQEQWVSAQDWIAARLENETLRSLLLFDAVAGGFAPSEPGTALALVWRAAQEMAGLQGAVALARPGTLDRALQLAASLAGVETAHGRATRILLDEGRAALVRLAGGETVDARVVVSALTRTQTLSLMGLDAGVEQAPVGEARMLFTLSSPHGLTAGRHILAGNAAHQSDAYEAARAGRLIVDPPLEMLPVDEDRIAVTLRPAPLGLDHAELAAAALKALARHLPDVTPRDLVIVPPAPRTRATLTRLLAPALARAATPAANVFLCGPDAEPVPCLSGRACRFAAGFALQTF